MIKVNDFVKMGDNPEAFKVIWIYVGYVGLSNGEQELIKNVELIDLDKYKISTYNEYYWSKK